MAENLNKNDAFTAFSLATAVAFAFQLALVGVASDLSGAAYFWVNGAYGLVICLAVVAFFAFFRRKNLLAALRVKTRFNALHVAVLLVAVTLLVMVSVPVNEWVFDFIEGLGLKRPTVSLTEEDVQNHLLLAVAVVCVLPALCEEVVFRGFVFGGFQRNFGTVKACLLSGALFSLFHLNPAQTLHQFVLGALLALFVGRSGSLLTAVVGHLYNNLFALFAGGLFAEDGFFAKHTLLVAAICAAALVGTVAVYFVKTRRDEQKQSEKTSQAELALFLVAVAVLAAMWVGVLLA